MRIDEVVLDRERLFKMKQQYDATQKIKKLSRDIEQAMEKQKHLEEWMNSSLDRIEHMPDKMFQLQLQPVIRNFMGGVSPIEVMYWALGIDDTFTEQQYQIARKVATENRSKIVEMLMAQLAEMDKLEKEANEKEWPSAWKSNITRFYAVRKQLQKLVNFFTKAKF